MSPDPELVKALLHDAKQACALLLTLMERMLHLDPETEGEEIAVLNQQVALNLPNTEIVIQNLRKSIDPWPERRSEFPSEVADEIDRFFLTLGKGLEGLRGQTNHRISETETLLANVQEEMKNLRTRSTGLQGYKEKTNINPEMLNRKI